MGPMAFVYGVRNGKRCLLLGLKAKHVAIIQSEEAHFDMYVNGVHIVPCSDDMKKFTIEGEKDQIFVSSDGNITYEGKLAGVKYTTYKELP
jgi:hypothetical protein